MTDTPLPRLDSYVRHWAAQKPDADALVSEGRRTSWARLSSEVDDLARALLAAGVAKGDRVGTLQTPRSEYVVAALASMSIGAIWVGLNPKYRVEELAHVVEDADPKVILTRTAIGARSYAAELDRLGAGRIVVAFDGEPALAGVTPMADFLAGGQGVSDASLADVRAGCGGREPCVLVYTSGSTGKPKGAVLHHQGIVGVSLEQNRIWPFDPMVTLNYFPINHVGCLVDVSAPTLVGGGTLVMMEQFEAAASMALMQAERITQWGSVPSVFQMQLELPDFESYDLSAVQMIMWEGAAMPEDMIRRLTAICPKMATNYSMTESTGGITVVAPTDDIDVLARSVGSAFAQVEIRLMDSDGREVPDGEAGEVWTRSPWNFLGYWNNPAATAEAITPDGFFRTGDLAVRRPDGRYRIAGRLKEMYKSGGYNVYPREVEAVLESHPAVALAAVVAVPDPLWDEVGVAYVQLEAQASPGELEAWCRDRLANYKLPKRVLVETELPLLPIGKVDKVTLKRRAAALALA